MSTIEIKSKNKTAHTKMIYRKDIRNVHINYKYNNQISLNLVRDIEEILESLIQLTVSENEL